MSSEFDRYLESGNWIGLDKFLALQRRFDVAMASRFGITSLGPAGFAVGLFVGYLTFS